jgi:hypothetical protein
MNIKELMSRHTDLELRKAAIQEVIDLIRTEFSSRDGIPPNKIVLTLDGKRVPPSVFSDVINDVTELVLNPVLRELRTLEEKHLD